MFGSNQFDGLLQKFDHLFALNDRIEAMVNPLGKMQAGLDAAMKNLHLADGYIGSRKWQQDLGLTNSLALSQRLNGVFDTLPSPVFDAAQASGLVRMASMAPTLPPHITSLLETLATVEGSFFKNWAGWAASFEQPAWVQRIESMQARFDHLLADLATEEVDEVAATALLSTEVFVVGSQALADPLADTWNLQEILAACTNLLAKVANSKTRKVVQEIVVYITFIVLARDEWRKAFPAPATPTVGEVAIRQEVRQERLQTTMLSFQLARQNGQLRVASQAFVLRGRPAGKAPVIGKLPADTELVLGAQVRAWVYVSCFNDDGEPLQGWAVSAQLSAKASSPTQPNIISPSTASSK